MTHWKDKRLQLSKDFCLRSRTFFLKYSRVFNTLDDMKIKPIISHVSRLGILSEIKLRVCFISDTDKLIFSLFKSLLVF